MRADDSGDRHARLVVMPFRLWPIAVTFAVSGCAFGAWIPFLPEVARRLALSELQIGIALGTVALAAAPAMLWAGAVLGRRGPAVIVQHGAIVLAIAFALPLHAPSLAWLIAIAALMGAAYGVVDVTMNASAAAFENAAGRSVMSTMHGCYSVGVFAGAGIAGAGLWSGIDAAVLTAAIALALLMALATASRSLPATHAADEPENQAALPSAVWLIGMAAALAMAVESATESWSTLWLTSRGATSSHAAMVLAMYAGSATIARFSGDALVRRWGRTRVLMASGVVATAGLSAALTVESEAAVSMSLAIAGAGTGNLVPILFAASAALEGASAAMAVSRVAAIGYTGLLLSPPAVGWLAERVTLGSALWLTPWLAAASVLVAATALRPRARASS
jgi:MFS family permease